GGGGGGGGRRGNGVAPDEGARRRPTAAADTASRRPTCVISSRRRIVDGVGAMRSADSVGGRAMNKRNVIGAIAVAAVLSLPSADAQAFDESKYPDIVGQWRRPAGVGIQWDQTTPL